jgi:hypothetical protein
VQLDGVNSSEFGWNSGEPIVYNLDSYGLTKGTYSFNIIVFDASRNYDNDTVIIIVTDEDDPIISGPPPADDTFAEGSSGNTITWTFTDTYNTTYLVQLDGVNSSEFGWNSGVPIVYPIDGLTKGVYIFNIIVKDSSGNFANDTVIVTVTDEDDPIITHPGDIHYAEDDLGNTITWIATDDYNTTYLVQLDGSNSSDFGWNSGEPIVYDIDGLTKGVYTFNIIVSDASGHFVNDTVIVTVTDETDPVPSSPADLEFFEGNTGKNITWVPQDTYPMNYTIFLNGIEEFSGSWLNNTPILVDIDAYSFTIGQYNFTIYLNDTSGNFAIDTVYVRVIEIVPPVIQNVISNPLVIEGSSGNTLSWNITDNYPGMYAIYQNGSEVDAGSWNSSEYITLDIDGLVKGGYNYTIIVFDSSFNQVNSTVLFQVIDGTDPVIFDASNDLTYEFGSIGNVLHWNGTDIYPGIYRLYQDAIEIDTELVQSL